MKVVADTHIWIWHVVESPRLSRAARAALKRAAVIGVHPVSCWEVAMLVEAGRLRLTLPVDAWVEQALSRPRIELLEFSAPAAVRAARFGAAFPGDPCDRFIVAAALEQGAPLVSADARIRDWGGIRVLG